MDDCPQGSSGNSHANPSPYRPPRPLPHAATGRAGPRLHSGRGAQAPPRESPAPADRRAFRIRAVRQRSLHRQRTTIPAHAFPRSSPTRGRPVPDGSTGCRPPARPAPRQTPAPGELCPVAHDRSAPAADKCPRHVWHAACASASAGTWKVATTRLHGPNTRTTYGAGPDSRQPGRANRRSSYRGGKTAEGSANAPMH
ncbi:hypothetical protein D3C71_1478650 [compost metagenome]